MIEHWAYWGCFVGNFSQLLSRRKQLECDYCFAFKEENDEWWHCYHGIINKIINFGLQRIIENSSINKKNKHYEEKKYLFFVWCDVYNDIGMNDV